MRLPLQTSPHSSSHQSAINTNLHEPHSSQTTLQDCVNYPNRYTTGTSIGLSKGLNANLQQRVNNHFANAANIKLRHTNLHEPNSSQTTLQGCVNSPNRYTTGTSIGLSKVLNTNLQQRVNTQFAKDVWQSL